MPKDSKKKKDPALAVLAEKGHEEVQLWYPYLRFLEEGYPSTLVGCGPKPEVASALGYPARGERHIENVSPKDFQALLIPGGVDACLRLRNQEPVLELIRSLDAAGKIVAAVGEGTWVLASSGVIRGRMATGPRTIKDDLKNAGAKWSDDPVVVDKNMITASDARQLPALMRALFQSF